MATKRIIQTKEEIKVAASDAMKLISTGAAEQLRIMTTAAAEQIKIIAAATDNATKLLATAVLEAGKLVATNAAEAGRLILANASEVRKQNNEQSSNDHDLIIEIKTIQQVSLNEIREIKSGTTAQIADIDARLKVIENGREQTKASIEANTSRISATETENKEQQDEMKEIENDKGQFKLAMIGIYLLVISLWSLMAYHILHMTVKN